MAERVHGSMFVGTKSGDFGLKIDGKVTVEVTQGDDLEGAELVVWDATGEIAFRAPVAILGVEWTG